MNVSRLVLSCRCKRKRKKIFRSIPQPDRVFSSPCLLKTRELGYFLESSCSQTDKPTRMRCYAVFAQTMAPLRHLGLTRDAAWSVMSVCITVPEWIHRFECPCLWHPRIWIGHTSVFSALSFNVTPQSAHEWRITSRLFCCGSVLLRKTSNGNEEIKRVRQGVLPFKGTWERQ